MVLVAPPGESREPAWGANPGYLVCGLAASLRCWTAPQFARFADWCAAGCYGEPMPDLRAYHQLRWTPRGAAEASVGRCLQFAAVPAAGDFPGGLLALAELHPDLAPGILAGMRGGQWGAMSVGGMQYGDPGGSDLWVTEVSLANAGGQADPGALVIGTGRDAAAAWELLTGSPPDCMSVRAPCPRGVPQASPRVAPPSAPALTASRGR